jgi:NAD(P)-dependent dehydrogenase (short-subunit alcohol dehydrogenase family)/acyl carrier protein
VARRLGAQIVATAGSARKRDFLRAVGVPHVLDSRASGLAERVAELTGGRGVDVVLGASSGDTAEQGIACLAPYGRFVEIGKNDSRRDHRLGLRPFARNLSYFCFDLRQMAEDRPDVVRADLTAVLAAFADGTLTPPPSRVFSSADVPDAMRRMSAPTHLGKIVIELDRAAVRVRPTPREVPLRGTWLITGGLGGFGLAMAEELAAAGVRDLVLLGRSGVRTAQDQDRIEDLTALGARVRVEAVDVTDEDALRRVVDDVRTTLRGVVHGAMVLDDMPITDLDQRSLDTVLGPKVLGAWHLHTMTADIELDAFVLFSSAASAISGRGQANYAAANAFLDHLAHARQAQGLPALAINWGAIADAGYLTRNKEIARMIEARGIGSLTATRAFQAMRALLATGRPQAAAMPMDWQRYLDYHAMTTDDQPRYTTVYLGAATRPGQELPLRERLHGTEDRVDLLAEHLRTHLATVLGMPASEVDDDMPLADYLDSLLSVSIGAWIERELSIRLNVMEVIQGTTVRQLVIRLLAMLGD